MEISQINQAIIGGNFTNDDLNAIAQAVTFARNQIARKNRFVFNVGADVKFTASRTGQVINGKIAKVNRKFVIINTNTGRWRVPMNMLEAA